MSLTPSILLLDDGELEQVRVELSRLGMDVVHRSGDRIPGTVERPRDLLITSGRRALILPRLEDPQDEPVEPVWICIHDGDFPRLRSRLRALGVHYLVHADIDPETLRLLLSQLLHQGAEKRRTPRLPIGCQLDYRMGDEQRKAVLVDLSAEGCRIVSTQEIPTEARVSLQLPPDLDPQARVQLECHSIRTSPCDRPRGFSVVLAFDAMEPQTRSILNGILAGLQPGLQPNPRVTPLERLPRPGPGRSKASPAQTAAASSKDRRQQTRREYPRRLAAMSSMDPDASQVALGRDLSMQGIRIAQRPDLEVGAHLSLALYGRPREEPMLIEAEVVRDDGERGLALRFASVTRVQERQLRTLLDQLPPVEALSDAAPDGERLIISKVLP